ncbi:MAG: SpoIIE family protein phosphatase [Proteobacteria bacterium]|nr:SpoIIE family protein phosphatase [Pseudomonadota bacterium]
MKILLAEDDPVTRLLYSRNLKACGYEVVTAENGEIAWQYLQTQPFQILISDWEMPELNGLELCQRVKSAPDLPYIFVLLLTARDDESSLIQGLDIGADDYLAKTSDIEVLKARIRSAGRLIQLTAELEAKNLHLKEVNERLDKAYSYIKRDLELAAKTQIGLLPPQDAVINGVRFDWLFVPSTFIGGDTLNYFRINEFQIAFYQLDVAGHGVASALHSFSLTKILSPAFNMGVTSKNSADADSPTAVLKQRIQGRRQCQDSLFATPSSSESIVAELNRRFQTGIDTLEYFTMAYGLLDIHEQTIDICLAGHQKPIYIPIDGKPELIGTSGFPVGILPESDYKSTLFKFAKGDRLFLHSDGIAECMNEDGDEFGVERLQASLFASKDLDLGAAGKILMSQLESWKGNNHFEDDISMLSLEIIKDEV